jgi:enamine deaminase RidA (YjgF/YER057c/UK114 family)
MQMERKIINPWTWQDAFGFVQANDVSDVRRVVICSGQLAADSDGHLVHPGDMRGQIVQWMDNLETVLKQAGLTLANVVRLNYYTTDVDGFIAAAGVLGGRLAAGGCRPASTLLGVTRLAFAEQVVELEATAVA